MQVKICGITHPQDALEASKAGADAIGLVFYAPSKRDVSDVSLAREISLSVEPFTNVVALFVNASVASIEKVLEHVSINTIQFHGDESPEFCESFNRPYIKALRMKQGVDVRAQCGLYSNASAILLDAYRKGVPGGTGEAFDWARVPSDASKSIVLAGGLSHFNVAQAIKVSTPSAVDVSGGVEVDGQTNRKDIQKINMFIQNAKGAQ